MSSAPNRSIWAGSTLLQVFLTSLATAVVWAQDAQDGPAKLPLPPLELQAAAIPNPSPLHGVSGDETTGRAIAVGEAGAIFVSQDAGATWQPVVSGTAADLRRVHCRDGRCVAVGKGGVCVLSLDGGLSWKLVETGVSNNLNAVHIQDSGSILAVGQSGVVVWSLDGQVWHQDDSGVRVDLLDVWGSVAVGMEGTILRAYENTSPEQGDRVVSHRWEQEESSTKEGLHLVWSADGRIELVAGLERSLLSCAYGAGWKSVALDGDALLTRAFVGFPSGSVWLVLDQSGAGLISGFGQSWVPWRASQVQDLRGAWMARSGTLLVVSADKVWRAGPPALARFEKLAGGSVLDRQQGLAWRLADGGQVTHAEALEQARNCSEDGRHDWTLPTAAQLLSLYDGALNARSRRAGQPEAPSVEPVLGLKEGDYWAREKVQSSYSGLPSVLYIDLADGSQTETAEENLDKFPVLLVRPADISRELR